MNIDRRCALVCVAHHGIFAHALASSSEAVGMVWHARRQRDNSVDTLWLIGTVHEWAEPHVRLPASMAVALRSSSIAMLEVGTSGVDPLASSLPIRSSIAPTFRDPLKLNARALNALERCRADGWISAMELANILRRDAMDAYFSIPQAIANSRIRQGKSKIRPSKPALGTDKLIAAFVQAQDIPNTPLEPRFAAYELFGLQCANVDAHSDWVMSLIEFSFDDDALDFALRRKHSMYAKGDASTMASEIARHAKKYRSFALSKTCQESQRNALWMNRAMQVFDRNLLQPNATICIAGGFAHFVGQSGDDKNTVPHLLLRHGFKIEPVKSLDRAQRLAQSAPASGTRTDR